MKKLLFVGLFFCVMYAAGMLLLPKVAVEADNGQCGDNEENVVDRGITPFLKVPFAESHATIKNKITSNVDHSYPAGYPGQAEGSGGGHDGNVIVSDGLRSYRGCLENDGLEQKPINYSLGAHFNTTKKWLYYDGHNAIDFGVPGGTSVLAAASGTVVTSTFQKGGYGNYVIIDHGNNYRTMYAHLQSASTKKKGDSVADREVIGKVGNTGCDVHGCKNHLHFGVFHYVKNQYNEYHWYVTDPYGYPDAPIIDPLLAETPETSVWLWSDLNAGDYLLTSNAAANNIGGVVYLRAENVSSSIGVEVSPSSAFQVNVQVKNVAALDWGTSVKLVNVSNPLGAGAEISLAGNVSNGEYYTWTLNMVAPSQVGTYTSKWVVKSNDMVMGDEVTITVAAGQQLQGIKNARNTGNINIPKGKLLPPGFSATNKWGVRNTGTVTWQPSVRLQFVSGYRFGMSSPSVSTYVSPGSEIEIHLPITTPYSEGRYVGNWRLVDENGAFFGDIFTIDITVQNGASAIGVGTGQVKLFTAANYAGTASSFGTGGTNAPDATAFSLQMPDGWSVRTYRADNYTGQGTNTRCWSASVPNLQDHDNWQGAIQSMQVYNYNDCGGGQSVKLYKQTNYVNLDREYLPELSNLPNKDTYSIDIPAGWSVWTYDQDNRGGGKKCWSSSVPNLQDTGWHNQIASIEVFTTNQCADNSNVLELCTNTGLTGCTAVNESTHSLQTSGFGNDNAKSIRVTGDWRAVLFHGENYEGAKQLFTSSDNDLSDTAVGNNQASSIQVRKVDPTRVILYDLGDLNGEPFPSDRTVVNLENWFFNDKAESVRVDPGYEVIICSDANFRGVCGRTNVNKNDLNDVAYGLRNNVSSVRVCEGSCPATSMVPIIAGPVDTASFLPGSDVAFSWVGNGEEYYIEYWGGDLSGTHNSNGIYGTTSWTKSGLPASQNPYYWHVRSWSPYGQTAWSPTYSFKVQDIGPKDVVIAGPDVATVNQNHIYTAFINPNDAANLNLVWSPTPVSGQGTLEATYNWTTVGPRSISLAVSNTGGNATGSLNIEVECPVGQYKVEYFGNKTLSGQPLETKCETGIDKTWNGSGPTVVPSNGFKVGDGSDGALDVPTGQTVYTDAVRTKVMNSAAIGENYICVQSTTGFEIGDEVLIIQSQGTGVGNYEFAKITQVSGCNLTLQSNLVNAYTTPNSKVQVLKVPNYTFVTVSGKLTAHPWDGDTGGVLAFRATNGVSLTGGSIDATALGYRGAPRTYGATMQARQGESTTGEGSLSRMHFVSAGGGGEGTSEGGTAGGGGAYRTPGGHGYDPSYGLPGHGSTILYGSDELTQLFFGSSGGAGGTDDSAWNGVAFGGRGGNGGGIIFIETNTITGTGSILNKGENGEDHDGVADSEQGGGGAGAGGSTKLLADKVDLDDVTVEYLGGLGGKAKEGVGGSGGSGQVYTRYCQNFSANALPGASAQESNCDKDNFSARWTADIDFATAGTYKFNTWTDDGTKLWVDDTLLVDRWVDQGGDTNYFGTKALTAGIHKVVMEYYENGGGAKAKLTIDQPTNSAPEVGQIPGQTITAGASFTTFDLDNYVTDADQGDTITWSYSGNTNLTVAIDTNKVVTITYPQNWTGENNITFRATDSANAFDEASALFKVNASATCPGQFQAEYFNNKTLSGTPVLARCEDEVDNDWGGGGPGNGVNNDNFSARWQKTMQLGAGDYTFGTASDDGVRLWLNNQLVIDNWTDHGLAIDEYEVTLAAGEYTVKMEYYESGGGAIAAFWMDFHGTVCDYLQGEFCAEYFDNPYLEGMPIYDTVEDEILNDWGGGGPGNGVPNDGFSARWKGSFYFAADDYDFTTGSDDGIRVWVDDVLIIDNWDPHGYEEDWVEIDLTEGYHDIKVEYYEYGGGALAGLWWED